MTPDQILPVVDTWAAQSGELAARPGISYVQIFENRGALMGCSNPHPHCQIWANEALPNEIAREQTSFGEYAAGHGSCLLCDYVALERKLAERVICENSSFAVLVPFWAIWPFETLVIAKRHVGGLDELLEGERRELAGIMKEITTRYDNLFETPFPYSLGFHGSPRDGARRETWHLHAHFYPPLLRSARVRKFVVGYEMLAMPQRDITAESAAARLRAVPLIHYRESAGSQVT
jgi:UDPglucose--hexose-1-phosphate uridylyltransferase